MAVEVHLERYWKLLAAVMSMLTGRVVDTDTTTVVVQAGTGAGSGPSSSSSSSSSSLSSSSSSPHHMGVGLASAVWPAWEAMAVRYAPLANTPRTATTTTSGGTSGSKGNA